MPNEAGADAVVTVFGGTGFLGRRLVEVLRAGGFAVRAASRHPERGEAAGERLETVCADVEDAAAVAAALDGAFAVVNAVSLYVERGGRSFRSVHVEAAERVARCARDAGVQRLVHLSGIGADPSSRSTYIRSRGEGEVAVRAAFPTATIVRPSVMVGPDDAFLTSLRRLVRLLPVIPLFGRGDTRLQPVLVTDVAEAIRRILQASAPAPLYELGGRASYRYAELLRTIARAEGKRPLLLPLPFALWEVGARLAELLPSPPITRDQVALMRSDNCPSPGVAGLAELGVPPRGLEELLRRTGQAAV